MAAAMRAVSSLVDGRALVRTERNTPSLILAPNEESARYTIRAVLRTIKDVCMVCGNDCWWDREYVLPSHGGRGRPADSRRDGGAIVEIQRGIWQRCYCQFRCMAVLCLSKVTSRVLSAPPMNSAEMARDRLMD